jgi:hypothetical protein
LFYIPILEEALFDFGFLFDFLDFWDFLSFLGFLDFEICCLGF